MAEMTNTHEPDQEQLQERAANVRGASSLLGLVGLAVLVLALFGGYGDPIGALINGVGISIILFILSGIGLAYPLESVPIGVLGGVVAVWLLLSAALLGMPPTAVWTHIFSGGIAFAVAAFMVSEASGVR